MALPYASSMHRCGQVLGRRLSEKGESDGGPVDSDPTRIPRQDRGPRAHPIQGPSDLFGVSTNVVRSVPDLDICYRYDTHDKDLYRKRNRRPSGRGDIDGRTPEGKVRCDEAQRQDRQNRQ